VLAQRANWPPVFVARAEIAELSGNPERAIKDLQEAINQGDTSLSAVGRLVTLLAAQGRDAEANRLLGRVRRSLLLQSELGRLADAWKGWECSAKALGARPADAGPVRAVAVAPLSAGRPKEGEPLLRRFRDGGVKGATPEDRRWARNGRAMVVANGTDYPRFG